MNRRTVFLALAAALVGFAAVLWARFHSATGTPTVRDLLPMYTERQGADDRLPEEHHRLLRWILNEMPSKRRLTEADATRLLAIADTPPEPDLRVIKRERYPDREIPEEVWLPINAEGHRRDAAAGLLVSWLQARRPMDAGVRERIVAWIVPRLDHEDPRERAAAIHRVLHTGILRERPDLRPKIEALRDDPDEHVALVARLQLEYYDEWQSVKKAWEAKRANR